MTVRLILLTIATVMAYATTSAKTIASWVGDSVINKPFTRLFDINPDAESYSVEIVGLVKNSDLKKGEISLVWDYLNPENNAYVSLKAKNRANDDPIMGRNDRYLDFKFSPKEEPHSDVIKDRKSDVFVLKVTVSANAIGFEFDDGTGNLLSFSTGKEIFWKTGVETVDKEGFVKRGAERQFGIVANVPFTLRRITATVTPKSTTPKHFAWTRETIDSYLAKSTDPLEGYWKHLDYSTDDAYARIAGKYTLAIIRQPGSKEYNIIYIDGAATNTDLWSTGCLKGRLLPTQFVNHYNLEWYTADASLISEDINASLDTTSTILTLNFPLLKATLRLARVPR